MLYNVEQLRIDFRKSLVQELRPLHSVASMTRTWPYHIASARNLRRATR